MPSQSPPLDVPPPCTKDRSIIRSVPIGKLEKCVQVLHCYPDKVNVYTYKIYLYHKLSYISYVSRFLPTKYITYLLKY